MIGIIGALDVEIAGIKSLNMQAIQEYCTPYEEWRLAR